MIDRARLALFWRVVQTKKKRQLTYLLLLSLAGSISEIVSITAIIPFLSSLTNPDLIFNMPLIGERVRDLNLSNSDLFFYTTVLFVLTTFLAYFVRLSLLWYTRRIAFGLGTDIATLAFSNALKKRYDSF